VSEAETPNQFPDDESGPDAIRRNFIAVAAATDTPAPGDGSRVPVVNLSQPISTLARIVGGILHPCPIFIFGESISTVDDSGRISLMNSERFPSWVENHLAFTRPTKDTPAIESIGKDLAGKILAADQFRDQLRELKGVSEVRLPVWNDSDEKRTLDLAPVGFDPGTGIFTVNKIPYCDDMSADDAWNVLWEGLKEFPFDPEGQEKVMWRRSFSAQLAVMLGVYCHALFPEGTPRPLIIFNANQSGSGKSLLMRVALAPVHGPPAESGKPESEAEFEKVLDSAAIARKPFLVLDDCKSIHSQALNRFVTSPVHECRLMHSQRMATVSKITQVIATGNGLSISEDLDRRALVVDLFEPNEAASRSFQKEITPTWLFAPQTRARFLAALWAIVKRWRDEGMPMMKEHRRGSFEEWSGLVGGIVISCNLTNPFTPRQTETAGDEAGRALALVIGEIVGEFPKETPPTLNTSDILERAETKGLLDIIVGFAKEPKKALGWRLKKLKGRHLLDSQRRSFEFGRRDMAAGAKYPIRFIG
jgi:hypothetical protein